MDQLWTFIQDNWVVVTVVLIALFLIVKIVKKVVKWVFVIVILAALFIYGSSYISNL
ncbi:MAG TPA: hypothetical protein VGE40_14980 [Bacilli bacterium]